LTWRLREITARRTAAAAAAAAAAASEGRRGIGNGHFFFRSADLSEAREMTL
jgi:hypothetical protein